MHRPEISVFLGVSLDGYIAGKNHDLSWLGHYATDDPETTGYSELMRNTDALVMGRHTYEAIRHLDPWPFGDRRVIVLTSRRLVAEHNECFFSGSLRELAAVLAAEGVRHVYLDGGRVVREALEAGLVDNLTLSWLPLLLGEGIPLFGGGLPSSDWITQFVRWLPSGIVQASYRRSEAGSAWRQATRQPEAIAA